MLACKKVNSGAKAMATIDIKPGLTILQRLLLIALLGVVITITTTN